MVFSSMALLVKGSPRSMIKVSKNILKSGNHSLVLSDDLETKRVKEMSILLLLFSRCHLKADILQSPGLTEFLAIENQCFMFLICCTRREKEVLWYRGWMAQGPTVLGGETLMNHCKVMGYASDEVNMSGDEWYPLLTSGTFVHFLLGWTTRDSERLPRL